MPEEIQNLLEKIDKTQEQIEIYEDKIEVSVYLNMIKEKEAMWELIKWLIKSGTTIEESKTLVFKTSNSYSYNPEKLKLFLWEEKSKHYIITEEKVDTKLLEKDIKAKIILEEVKNCKVLKSTSVTIKAKKDILTEKEI